MPVLLGQAKPDCSYKDPKSLLIIRGQEGCPRQAQFKIWIQNVDDGAYKDKPIFACRSHAGVLFKMMQDLAKEMRRLKDNVRVFVVDLDLQPGDKKAVTLLVAKTGSEKRLAAIMKGKKH